MLGSLVNQGGAWGHTAPACNIPSKIFSVMQVDMIIISTPDLGQRPARSREGDIPNCSAKLHDPCKPAFRRLRILPQQLGTSPFVCPCIHAPSHLHASSLRGPRPFSSRFCQKATLSSVKPEDRSITKSACRSRPGSQACTFNLPSAKYLNVTSTGVPAGSSAGRFRTIHFPIEVAPFVSVR